MATNVILNKGEIPSNSCFTTVSALYDLFINSTSAEVAGDYSLFNFGDTIPSAEDTDKPWIRTIAGQPDRLYYYYNGAWVSKHPVPYVAGASGERKIYVGALGDIDTYDGGSSGSVTLTTGPFWERDTEFNAKFPVGIGNTENGTEITEASKTGGSDQTVLQESNLPPHDHDVIYNPRGFETGSINTGSAEGSFKVGAGKAGGMVIAGGAQSSDAFTNLPPYYGVYFIKRTARVYYTV
jgi:hypothetical protein